MITHATHPKREAVTKMCLAPPRRTKPPGLIRWIACLALVVWAPAMASAETRVPPPLRAVAVREHQGTLIPLDTPFISRGLPVRLGDYFDGERPVILILAYTRCPMLCNLVLRGAMEALPQLEWRLGHDFRALTVLIDSEETDETARQKQETLLAALGKSGRPERWPFLRGHDPSIRAVSDAVGFTYERDPRTGQIAHPAVLVVLTPSGRVSSYLHGVRFEPTAIREALSVATSEGSLTEATIGASVMSCFRFDPALRQHGPMIQRLFRLGGAGLFVSLLVLVGSLVHWERRRK